ncbi:hypothetical protein HDU83_002722 [Entophlyctis luteolus]|nr:hypothetical protein HDU82_005680 [Entophlyctis luteolus]KAJ3355717.1 hypothetical protein HDU83_002722 [Entophlyctis luteolus]KAJ3393742.1 hypothetical protein HDU84_001149 [Entophlyctis sp. JEL0112]
MSTKVASLQKQVEDVTAVMNSNVNQLVANSEALNSLKDNANSLESKANVFNQKAKNVRKAMWWKDMKMKAILAGVVLVIILIIIRK